MGLRLQELEARANPFEGDACDLTDSLSRLLVFLFPRCGIVVMNNAEKVFDVSLVLNGWGGAPNEPASQPSDPPREDAPPPSPANPAASDAPLLDAYSNAVVT